MAPYFAHNALTVTLSAVTLVTWQVLELRQSLRRRPGAHLTDHGSNHLLRGVAAVGWLVAALATARLPGTAIAAQPAAFVAGLVVAWVGLGLRVWAFHTLGEYFTFHVQTSEDQPVITTGPYRFVRHPSYSGLELILIGRRLAVWQLARIGCARDLADGRHRLPHPDRGARAGDGAR
jgi:protein-S-isoprenylcysteine O-methyltransferase Ste14